MAKKVVIIVSGETDRRAIPHLCRHVAQHAALFEVRKPPGNAALTPEQAARLIRAAWCELLYGRNDPPDKFVVLVDSNGRSTADAARPFEEAIASLNEINVHRLVAVAVRHLEAWFFAHSEKLRDFLGRDLGNVDPSQPDEIDNPKLHLQHLLISRSRVYTALVADQIAAQLDPNLVEGRSPSFAAFIGKVRNGAGTVLN